MNQAGSHPAAIRGSEGLYKMGGFDRKQGGAREPRTKGKKRVYLGTFLFWSKERKRVFIMPIASFPRGTERDHDINGSHVLSILFYNLCGIGKIKENGCN